MRLRWAAVDRAGVEDVPGCVGRAAGEVARRAGAPVRTHTRGCAAVTGSSPRASTSRADSRTTP